MSFNKYKNMLFQKIKSQISLWFESKEDLFIPNSEVYVFLHSMYGTSGTLQLTGLNQLSGRLMKQIEEYGEKQWAKDELRNFLDDLICLAYEYEHFLEADSANNLPRGENIPLIQILDEDISMLILLKDALEEKGWMVVANTNSEKAISQCLELNPDCIIIETQLKNRNGFQVLHDLQNHHNLQFVPKIMISLKNDRETRLNAYYAGADDFIEKPLDLEEVTVRVERLLNKKKLIDQSVLLDDLTKLYNRKFLNDIFYRSIKDLHHSNHPFSLALLDLDHFKKINDQFGHVTGDNVLVAFADFLKENTRNRDIVFRYGGEEFVILFQNTSLLTAADMLSVLVTQFSQQAFESGREPFSVTFSAGVTSIDHPETSLENAIKAADQALYKAKENGRARVETIHQQSAVLRKQPLFVSIIDDDAIIRTMLMKVLQTMDTYQYELQLEAFENGMHFFDSKRLEQKGQHFLILDGVMPVMDGIEILQKARKMNNTEHLHVLMLTGRKSDSDIARALELGADDYVTKPFSIKELQARIQRLIKREK